MNLVKKILNQIMRGREGGSKASKVVARLFVTKFRDKYFGYSQFPYQNMWITKTNFRRNMNKIGRFLGLENAIFPTKSLDRILERFIKDLSLPSELFTIIKTSIQVYFIYVTVS